MERLTTKRKDGRWALKNDDGATPWEQINKVPRAIDRLAAYEDTRLEPEEITTEPYGCVFYCNRKCNLYGDFCAEGPGCPYEIGAEAAKNLLELAQAEKDGRLVVLPCKVGDTVWTNVAILGDRYKSADKPYPVKVVFIGIGGYSDFFQVQYSNGRMFPFNFDEIGKTVFLTHEEAEAALKKREEDT